MYCPKCGTSTSDEQKFCRSCGMNLLPVSQMLTGSLAPNVTDNSKHSSPLTRSKVFRWGFGIMWMGLLLILIMGIGGDAARSLSPKLGKFIEDLAGLGVIPLLGGVGLMIYSKFVDVVPALPKSAQRPALPPDQHTVTGSPVRKSEPAPSVTEGTTYHLDVPEDIRRR